ncbi:DEAD/DEAH box helicase [Erysipelothrix sp. D19-032]
MEKRQRFGIPVVDRTSWDIRTPQTIVLTPTRELALQVRDELTNIGRNKRLKVQAVYGKDSFEHQRRDLAQRTHIVVATPGRLFDHLTQETINVSEVTTVVLDEADEMLSMGFLEQIDDVLQYMPRESKLSYYRRHSPKQLRHLRKVFERSNHRKH